MEFKDLPHFESLKIAQHTSHQNGTAFLSLDSGFLPSEPLPPLPYPFSKWETEAKRIPSIASSDEWPSFISSIPHLQHETEALQNSQLLRANLTLAILAHSIKNIGKRPVPDCILEPWKMVSNRLGRTIPSLSAFDLTCYNIQSDTSQAARSHPFKPTLTMTGSLAETNFIIQSHNFETKAIPLLRIILRAQKAVLESNNKDLRSALIDTISVIENMTIAFQTSNPRPSSKYFMDHVEWGRAMDVQTTSVFPGEKTGSGLLMPSIHLLDCFFTRDRYHTEMGKFALRDRVWMPALHRELFQAVSKVSVYDYIATCSPSARHELETLFRRAHCSFAAESGFLGKHRIRLTGYLEMSFKTGRQSTGSGMKAGPTWETRAWRKVNDAMLHGMKERLGESLDWTNKATVIECNVLDGFRDVFKLTINTKGALIYKPGDHLAILAKNDRALVEKALNTIGLRGTTLITITNENWLCCLANRGMRTPDRSVQGRKEEKISLKQFFECASLKPWSNIVNAFQNMSGNSDLRLDRVLVPLLPRYYSVASHMSDSQNSVSVVFRKVQYKTQDELKPFSDINSNSMMTRNTSRNQKTKEKIISTKQLSMDNRSGNTIISKGISSSYLSSLQAGDVVNARIVPELGFRLPEDHSVPVIMISLGLGVTPFLSFLKELESRNQGKVRPNKSWLILGTKYRRTMPFLKPIEKAACELKVINASLAVSREHVQLDENASVDKLVFRKGKPKRVSDLLREDKELLKRFWNIIQNKGHVYACGVPALQPLTRRIIASSVQMFGWGSNATDEVLSNVGGGRSPEDYINKMAGEGRLHFDCYNSGKPSSPGRTFTWSEIAEHGTADSSWVTFRDSVYDITEYLQMHPGGPKILIDKAGRDMSKDFEIAHGSNNLRIESMLEPYKIGTIRKFSLRSVYSDTMHNLTMPILNGVLERRSIFALDMNSFSQLNEPATFADWRSHHSSNRYRKELLKKFQDSYEPEMFMFLMRQVELWTSFIFGEGKETESKALQETLTELRKNFNLKAEVECEKGLVVCSTLFDSWVSFAIRLQREVETSLEAVQYDGGEEPDCKHIHDSMFLLIEEGIAEIYNISLL